MSKFSKIHESVGNNQKLDDIDMRGYSMEEKMNLADASAQLKGDIAKLHKDGFVIFENLLGVAEVAKIKQMCLRLLERTPTGRNNFEGFNTRRVYSLVSQHRIFDSLLLHPRITQLCDGMLSKNNLLTAFQSIEIRPNEKRQILHYDDQYITLKRTPRQYTGVCFMWAIDDFTATNGATNIIPKSHLWPTDRLPTDSDKLVPVIMQSGSCVCFLSTLWHCGGANETDKPRIGITNQHSEPWLRAQENWFLSVPFEVVPTLHPRLQSMLGYSIGFPIVGYCKGSHPLKTLHKRIQTQSKL